MFKSPSRNQRSKGFKVKHALQICLLLAVCFWLIYQVKHSHDKKKEFDATDRKISSSMQGGNEVVKLGRKDLHPRQEEEPKGEKHGQEENVEEDESGEAEEEERKHDEEQEEEESKHDEELEEEEGKASEGDDEGRGDGDDEIDENDEERAEGESDRDVELLDDEKEREEEGNGKETAEKEIVEKDDLSENDKDMDGQDHDDGSRNVHEAREEHYKADDASSAVTHDAQTNGGEANKMEDFDENTLEQETKPNNSEFNVDHNNSKAEELELAGNEASSNLTDSQEKGSEISTPKSENSLLLNTPIAVESNVQPEVSNNNSSEVNHESSEVGVKPSDSDAKNGTGTISDPVQAQNATQEGMNTEHGADMQDVNIPKTTISNTTTSDDNQSASELENAGATAVESSNSTSSVANSEAEHNPESLISEQNTDATQNEKQDANSGSGGGTDESSSSSSKDEGAADQVQHDPIDVSDSPNPQEEKEPPPRDSNNTSEIRTDVSEKEGAATE